MKTKLLFLVLLISASVMGQTDFRADSLVGVPKQVSIGNTVPRLINIVNDTSTVLFVRIYDQVTRPFSTSIPVLTLMVPANSSSTINIYKVFPITNGLWIRAGKGTLKTDTTWNKWKNIPPVVEIVY